MKKANQFIYNTFLKLTKKTYPHGFENDLVRYMQTIGLFPFDLKMDQHGNYYYKIGESRTIFASHLDTVGKEQKTVNHIIEGNIIKTDGTTILGADDKAGVTLMLFLIKNNIPGLYYFFVGEEVGCIGSGKAAKSIEMFKNKYDRIISFDRRDVGSVITFQSYTRCCSDSFADELASQLNIQGMDYSKDDGGVYTDSAEFVDIIPECTNLSVGYYKEHTSTESQDIIHLSDLAEACLNVNWEELPTERDCQTIEYKEYNYKTKVTYSRDYSTYDSFGDDDFYDEYALRNNSLDKFTTSFDELDEWDEWEELDQVDKDLEWERYKKSLNKNTKPREYLSYGSNISEYRSTSRKYDWVINKFCGELTDDELAYIKEIND